MEPLTTTFTLTRADALAYERRPRPLRPLPFALFLLWLVFGAGLILVLPHSLTGGPQNPLFWVLGAIVVAIFYVLAMIRLTFGDLRRARRRIRRAFDVTFEEYDDGFSVSGDGIPRYVTFDEAGEPLLTPTHLFLGTGDDLVILPRRAFPEDGTIEELAERVTEAGPATRD